MKRFEEDFKDSLVGLDFDTIENFPHTIYGLSKELKLNYFNSAWLEFATMNNGEPDISSRFPIGTPIEKALAGGIKDFYIDNYSRVLRDLRIWNHEYECSSASIYRLFYQNVYPLKNGDGIIIVNGIRIEKPFDEDFRPTSKHPISEYLDANGFIAQCSNCRKTQRVSDLKFWDWVPAFVKKMPENVSHSICPICYDYYWKFANV
ncbi:MAG: hypothetical protein IPP38_11765 [Bacteroidetes bacterium]|nr:hypothetical protein [Bacteroidota bacterium]